MIRLPAIFLLLLIPPVILAQRVISGTVLNKATGDAIAGCSVFISNTSGGTTTNSQGYFELTNVPQGKHDLVVSCVGYQTQVFEFADEYLPMVLKVELMIKAQELPNITLEAFEEGGWDKWGKVFTDNFIGYTSNAQRTIIRNKEVIRFRFFKRSNRLIAYADEPLRIENKALGYTITYQLVDFEVDFKNSKSIFAGYSLFAETGAARKAWQRRRQQTYEGSMMHFVRSLYAGQLLANGFEVRRMVQTPNTEKERVRVLYKPTSIVKTDRSKGFTQVEIKEPDIPDDSIKYYREVMRQPDRKQVFGKEMVPEDSLIVKYEGVHKLFYFSNHLFITYKGEKEEPEYLQFIREGRKPGPQLSFLNLPELKGIWIEANGHYYNCIDLFSSGYWGWSDKIADSLPLDYEPDK